MLSPLRALPLFSVPDATSTTPPVITQQKQLINYNIYELS
jgi:hypothetical protein